MKAKKTYEELEYELQELRVQLDEANDTVQAIRGGEVDALIVNARNGHEIFTLRSADQTYRVFIEKMREGAVTLNHLGMIVYSNSSFATMVGKDSQHVVAELFEQFVFDPDRAKFQQLLNTGWNEDIQGEIRLLCSEDDFIHVQLSITALAMDENSFLSIIVSDLTALKENVRQLKTKNDQLAAMNIALELSNHDLQQFASVASHDLQEPLRKIQVFSNLLKENYRKELSDIPRNYLDRMVASASRMKVLIIDILNYSRLSANDNQFEKTDLKEIIADVVDDFELVIKERNATIIIHDLPAVEVNHGQMRQVFQNLISNALKFCKKNIDPLIEIYTTNSLGDPVNNVMPIPFCQLHIKDNGIGFDEQYSQTIFNLFKKLHSKDEYEGTGIGLAITKKIVEKHNGQIDVKSTVGVGTEFIISLPLKH